MEDVDYLVRKIEERRGRYTVSKSGEIIQRKMLRSLLVNDVLDKPHIFRIELINTLNCNAKCAHCSNYKLGEDEKVTTKETVLKILEEAKKHQTPSINFLGGEALVDKNIFEYLSWFIEADIGVTLQSNAIRLNRDVLIRLKEMGVSGVGTTIYDTLPENHDKILRVPGTLKKIFEAIEISEEIGLPFNLQTIYSREGVKSGAIKRIMDFCKEKGKSLKLNIIMPVGGSADEKIMLSGEELEEFKKMVLSDSCLSTHCIFNKHKEVCPMGRTFVGITPKGDMMPCYFMPFIFGNIHDTTFDEYLEYAQSFPIFRKEVLPKGYCIVAESKKFFREILDPLYSGDYKLPIDIRENKDFEEKLRSFKIEDNT